MTSKQQLLNSVQSSPDGISLSQWLLEHPDVARRSAQRWLTQFVQEGLIQSSGEGRARCYKPLLTPSQANTNIIENGYSDFIPLSEDSRDILSYIDQTIEVRSPVGYQHDFLDTYKPNETWYLSASLRRQLKKMGTIKEQTLPAGTYGREILSRLLIDLSWASSHLEGNTYSRLDTQNLIVNGQVAQGKAAIETQMILNHKSAIELLVENIDSIGFDRFTLLNLHSSLSENLLSNPSDEGRIRTHIVEIGKSVFRPLSVPAQIDEVFTLVLNKASQISDPFEQSFFMMVHLPYLQPFADINKRTSRLAANLPLIRANLCPLTFLDVPEKAYSQAILGVYELTRVELLRDLFVWAYERSTKEYLAIKQGLTEPDPLRLAFRDVIKQVIYEVVINHHDESLAIIQKEVKKRVQDIKNQPPVEALVIEELRRLHEGNLARYGLRPSEYQQWKNKNK